MADAQLLVVNRRSPTMRCPADHAYDIPPADVAGTPVMGRNRQALRIGIDGTCLRLRRGYSRFLQELLPALLECDHENTYLLFLDTHTASTCPQFDMESVLVPTATAQADAAAARSSRPLGDMWRMGRAVARADLDLMYFPSVYSYYPVPGDTPVAVTFHDTIAERYGEVVFPTRRQRWFWRLKVFSAQRRARGILTVSEWSRSSLADWFGIPAEKIYVTPEAASTAFRPLTEHELDKRSGDWKIGERPYLIYVGGFNPHKNLGMLVEVFGELVRAAAEFEVQLALVGDYETDQFYNVVEALRRKIRDAEVSDSVHFLGYVPDDRLRHLYAGAVALVLPSLEEGFGLPAVEAAACGTPCVATRNSPLPGLLEGGGLFFDPQSPQELLQALQRVIGEPGLRRELAAGARERAGLLSWQAAAEATRRALESIARG